MEEREQLLKNLQGVKSQISKILKVMDEQTNIVASFRQSEASISTTGLKAALGIGKYAASFTLIADCLLHADVGGAALYAAILAFLHFYKKKSVLKTIATVFLYCALIYLPFYAFGLMADGYIVAGIIPLVFFVVGIAGTLALIRMQNKKIEAKNMVIQQRNAELQEQYDLTVQKIKQQRAKLNQLISGWYPGDYCSLEAVNFFIGAISNFKADSMKEAVILFDDSQHKKKMLASQQAIADMNRQQIINQEEISKQMRFANILSMANLSLQSSTLDAVNRNTDAVNDASFRAEGSANRVVDAINQLRK